MERREKKHNKGSYENKKLLANGQKPWKISQDKQPETPIFSHF